MFAASAGEKLGRLRAELAPLAEAYDVVVANPPYMGAKNMNAWLSGWVKENYPDVKGDLFSCFMTRNSAMGAEHAQMGFMTPYVWMFIGTYEKLRRFVIERNTITSLVQLEYSGFSGATVPICTFTLQKGKVDGYRGGYVRLSDFPGADQQAARASEALANPDCGWFYRADAGKFGAIPGSPIAYWASDAFIRSFDLAHSIDSLSDFTGSRNKTGDNDQFVRFFWEAAFLEIGEGRRWVPYAKGGDFRRWFGNSDHVVDWSDSARTFYSGNQTSCLLSKKYWFQEGVTYNAITSGKPHFRYLPKGCVFDMGGPAICGLDRHLSSVIAFLNSSICEAYLDVMNPTLNLQGKDIKALPLLPLGCSKERVDGIAQENINLSKNDWDAFETSWDFKRHPLV